MEVEPLENASLFLPAYLFPEQAEDLKQELKNFPDFTKYYFQAPDNEILQGDGWNGFNLNGESNDSSGSVKGLVLSNTCDVASNNTRNIEKNVLFSPLVSLEKYRKLLESSGIGESRIKSILNSIRTQKITDIFYLPESSSLEECIILLDHIDSTSLSSFKDSTCQDDRIFSLSQPFFYLFLLKLSIHFSRFQENVARF